MTSGCDFDDLEPRLPPEKKSPCGCHTMFLQVVQRIVWFLYPINCFLQAGHSPCTSESELLSILQFPTYK